MPKIKKNLSGKIKNPCKICFETVNERNGLRCEGACKKWVHYKCLNYTPGKIQDIQKGYIKINCPCPNCDAKVKEIQLKDAGHFCGKSKCPASQRPICDTPACPAKKPIPNSPPVSCPEDCLTKPEPKPGCGPEQCTPKKKDTDKNKSPTQERSRSPQESPAQERSGSPQERSGSPPRDNTVRSLNYKSCSNKQIVCPKYSETGNTEFELIIRYPDLQVECNPPLPRLCSFHHGKVAKPRCCSCSLREKCSNCGRLRKCSPPRVNSNEINYVTGKDVSPVYQSPIYSERSLEQKCHSVDKCPTSRTRRSTDGKRSLIQGIYNDSPVTLPPLIINKHSNDSCGPTYISKQHLREITQTPTTPSGKTKESNLSDIKKCLACGSIPKEKQINVEHQKMSAQIQVPSNPVIMLNETTDSDHPCFEFGQNMPSQVLIKDGLQIITERDKNMSVPNEAVITANILPLRSNFSFLPMVKSLHSIRGTGSYKVHVLNNITTSCSDSNISSNTKCHPRKMLLHAMEQMYSAMGQFHNQFKDLMFKMMVTLED